MSVQTPEQHTDQGNAAMNAATQQSVEQTDEAKQEYVAPFTPFNGVPLKPNYYMVTLFDDWTPQQHWEAIGEELRVTFTGKWYSATLTDEQRERIRRDTGVKNVKQYGRAIWG